METPFQFSSSNVARVNLIKKHFPSNKQQSAIIPVLDLAQRQVCDGGSCELLLAWNLNLKSPNLCNSVDGPQLLPLPKLRVFFRSLKSRSVVKSFLSIGEGHGVCSSGTLIYLLIL